MKKILIPSLIIVLLGACSSDKKAQLEKLEQQREEIDKQIVQLTNEIGGDTLAAKEAKAMYVEVSDLHYQPFSHFIEVQGILDSEENIGVMPQASGQVKKIYVQEGSQVTQGQLLLELDAQVLKHTIEEIETSLDFATEMYNKQKALWDEKIGSEVQYLTAKNKKEALEKKLATLKEQLDMTKITSPINGVVDKIMTKEGELIAPSMPVLRVVNLSKIKVNAAVAENYASNVKQGTDVILWFPDVKIEIPAKVSYAGKVIDPVNRTFDIVIRLDKITGDLKPNMLAVAKIVDFQKDSAISVPINTIRKSGEDKFVYIAEKDNERYVARKQQITTDVDYNGMTLISNGLKPGDKLITFGFQELTDGQPVIF